MIDSFEIKFKSAFRNLKSAILICAMLLALCASAQAQQPKKIHRIGFLIPGSTATFLDRVGSFRQGLRDLGDVEGKDITIEYRYADGKLARLPDLAADLIRLKVDLIAAAGSEATAAAKKRDQGDSRRHDK